MYRSSMTLARALAVTTIWLASQTGSCFGANAYPVFTDLNDGGLVFGSVQLFDNTVQMEFDETGVYKGNDILVTTLVGGGDLAGLGFNMAISNGENGINETDCQGLDGACDGTGNVDIPNTEPVNAAIAAVNAGGAIPGKLNNGNVIRASVWMRSDPNSPATGVGVPGAASMPQVEGILKIELWKEALSPFGDFDGPGDSDRGDRIWDQDQQGGAGSFVDINADGFSGGFGAPVTVTLNTETWTQMVVEYVVDDNPANPGNTTFPWDIGLDEFTVADVEDVRAVFFAGDFTGTTDFAGGGSWWMDNLLLEVFANQADANAVSPLTTNPAPIELDAEPGDFDADGDVDGDDFVTWSTAFAATADGDADGDNDSDGVDFLIWQRNFTGPPGGLAATTSVPEPMSAVLGLVGYLCIGAAARHRRSCRRGA